MKKLGIFLLTALFVVLFTLPAPAVEHQFGGYWRTRFYSQQNFTGEDDTEANDLSQTDTRTRLYYTAILNENLKLVNQFEMDTDWGDGGAEYGDIGADGIAIEVKNTYAEITSGSWLSRIGTQGLVLGRGFLFDDDGTGILAMYRGEGYAIPFVWLKVNEGGMGKDANEKDVDGFVVSPSIQAGDGWNFNPYILYIYSDDGSAVVPVWGDINWWHAGLNVDFVSDAFSLWATGIMQWGDMEVAGDSMDFGGYLLGLGGSIPIGPVSVFGDFVYASGDDDAADSDIDAFTPPAGASYYWAEIMGLGIFDNQASNNSGGDVISNIYWFHLGAGFNPAEKLKVKLDLWYASLVEDITDAAGDSLDEQLGTEIDLTLTYELVEGLNLDLVGAYLFAGESTTEDANDDANPYEIGAQLSLSF